MTHANILFGCLLHENISLLLNRLSARLREEEKPERKMVTLRN